MQPTRLIQAEMDGSKTYQSIDGFGVNINSKYWAGGAFAPVLDVILYELGASLFRVDIFGKSNWVDPNSEKDARALNEQGLSEIYRGEVAQNGFGLMRYLNQHGIKPYLTCSGDVPKWMLGADGKTLTQIGPFCDLLVSLLDWAKKKEGLDFEYFGPLNETDIGSPEGPSLTPEQYVHVIEILDNKLKQHALDDIRLVVAEQAHFNLHYVNEFIRHPKLADRLSVIGMHTYGNCTVEQYREIVDLCKASSLDKCRVWMSEYGDLEQSGEKEWFVAWVMTERLLAFLRAGFNGAMAWDAFDNYHDHDEAWTIYGLIRTGLRTYTPKKRFYASKHVYRYVLPGFERIDLKTDDEGLNILGFSNPERSEVTIVGMNTSSQPKFVNIKMSGFSQILKSKQVRYLRTNEEDNCVEVGRINVTGAGYPFDGLTAQIPPMCIFTLTTVI
jgi:O-glycosyl hydrolase